MVDSFKLCNTLLEEFVGKFILEDLVVNGISKTIYVVEFQWLRMLSIMKTSFLYAKRKFCLEEMSNSAH